MTTTAHHEPEDPEVSSSHAPRSRAYDGALFALLIDPINAELHAFVAKQIETGARVLDIGCGTGALAFRVAPRAAEVVGVDLSPAMVAYANRRLRERGTGNVSFVVGDAATALAGRPDASFDVATLVMVLHEIPAEARARVLRDATRLAARVLCLDYRIPLPQSPTGWLFRGLEIAAGLEHYRAFRDYSARGGTEQIASAAGLNCRRMRSIARDAIEVSEIRSWPTRAPGEPPAS